MNEVTNPNRFVLGKPEDFSQADRNYISDLINEKLADKGIRAAMYFYEIHVEYVPWEESQ